MLNSLTRRDTGSVRLRILKDLVVGQGGVVDAVPGERTTHLITDEGFQVRSYRVPSAGPSFTGSRSRPVQSTVDWIARSGSRLSPALTVHTSEWLTSSNRARELLDEAKHVPFSTQVCAHSTLWIGTSLLRSRRLFSTLSYQRLMPVHRRGAMRARL